jgi:phage N-6-adenine-methyltransferase
MTEAQTKTIFSSEDNTWETPIEFFNELNREFNFTLDPCCETSTAKCSKYYTKEDDGLSKNWQGETVFCNPPYGREIYDWVEKCSVEGNKPNTTVVMLIPSRTDTRWFHEFIHGKAEIRFIKGRLKFGNSKNSAPFPSMVVIFR